MATSHSNPLTSCSSTARRFSSRASPKTLSCNPTPKLPLLRTKRMRRLKILRQRLVRDDRPGSLPPPLSHSVAFPCGPDRGAHSNFSLKFSSSPSPFLLKIAVSWFATVEAVASSASALSNHFVFEDEGDDDNNNHESTQDLSPAAGPSTSTGGGSNGQTEGGAPEDDTLEDDFNAAWEVLDAARTLFGKMDGPRARLQEAECLIALGDLCLETGSFTADPVFLPCPLSQKKRRMHQFQVNFVLSVSVSSG